MECGSSGAKSKVSKYVCARCGKEEMRAAKEGEEVKSCCGQVMVEKEKYLDKLAAQLKEWGAKIDQLEDKAKKGTMEAKIAISKEVEALNKMMKDAKKNLQETSGKTGEAWKVFAQGADKAWDDLKEAVHRAHEKYK